MPAWWRNWTLRTYETPRFQKQRKKLRNDLEKTALKEAIGSVAESPLIEKKLKGEFKDVRSLRYFAEGQERRIIYKVKENSIYLLSIWKQFMEKDQLALNYFHPLVANWFAESIGTPTDLQALAWPQIAAGENVLIAAPTGSGKTMAAFLWAINELITGKWPPGRIHVLYVSPLKALNNDIRRNLIGPLSDSRLFHEIWNTFTIHRNRHKERRHATVRTAPHAARAP